MKGLTKRLQGGNQSVGGEPTLIRLHLRDKQVPGQLCHFLEYQRPTRQPVDA